MPDDENRESLFQEVEEVEKAVLALDQKLSQKLDRILFVVNLIYVGMNPPPDGKPHLLISIGPPTEQSKTI